MKAEVLALVDELKRLRGKGVDRVFVSDESIRLLRKAGKGLPGTREEVLESIPENVRTANANDFDKMVVESKSPAAAKAKREFALASSLPKPPVVTLPEGDKETRWNALRDMVLNCRVCAKHVKPGKKIVFGVGNIDADIFFCGEAPGAEEEVEGEPFVGKAGQLLNKMIQAMGMKREDVYIGNIMNWRPEMATEVGNRPPSVDEMNFCLPYLKAQLAVVQPKLIVALGATAVKGLFGAKTFRSLREVKGQWQEFEGIPVMPTYHPSYLLRNDNKRDKRSAWEDWLKVMEKTGMPISDRQRGYFL